MDIPSTMAALQVTGAQNAQPGHAAPDAAQSAAREFEAMFLGQMVDEMLAQVDIGDFGGGQAEEHWRSFMAEALGKQIAEQGGSGIAASLRGALEAYAQGRQEQQG